MSASAPYLASAPRRIAAAAIDLGPVLLLVIVALGVVDKLHVQYSAMPLAAFLVFVAYHATFQHYWFGETPGCRFVSIRIVGQGKMAELSLTQCIARPCLTALWLACFFPVAIGFRTPWLAVIPALIDLVLMSSLPTRQTIADLVCRTFVVKTPPLQPHRAPAAPMFSATDAEFGVRPHRVKRIEARVVPSSVAPELGMAALRSVGCRPVS